MPWLRAKPITGLVIAMAALCAAATALTSCARSSSVLADNGKDYAALSAKLTKDMTEAVVAQTLGGTPSKADLTTCTDHAGKEWQCRTWIFAGGKPKNNLRVVFYQADDHSWRVAAWDLF